MYICETVFRGSIPSFHCALAVQNSIETFERLAQSTQFHLVIGGLSPGGCGEGGTTTVGGGVHLDVVAQVLLCTGGDSTESGLWPGDVVGLVGGSVLGGWC